MDSHKNASDKKGKEEKTDPDKSADAVDTPTPPQHMNPSENPAREETQKIKKGRDKK